MHLQREVASAHRVEEVEADRELRTKPSYDGIPQQLMRFAQHDVVGRGLECRGAEPEEHAVLLRHTVKAPAEVVDAGIEAAHLLHPATAPGRRLEPRNNTERSADHGGQRAEIVAGRKQRGCVRAGRVQDEVEVCRVEANGRKIVVDVQLT